MDHRERTAVRVRLSAVFQAAAKERPKRPDIVRVEKTLLLSGRRFVDHECAWVTYEREQMLAAVNVERASRGLEPVTIQHIERVEQMACGHVDYAVKYPLYCSEIALGEDRPSA
jgi:phosphopantetheine adenylyltransferase